MPARDLTADDIADWLTPRQAVEILNAELEDTYLSKHALLERLRGGMVQAVAGHSAVGERGKGARQLFFKIPADHWESIQTADTLWQTGDLKYTFKDYGATERITLRHYDVRFEPQGVHAIIANSRPTVNTESKAFVTRSNVTNASGIEWLRRRVDCRWDNRADLPARSAHV
jgi:hypothetical protein